MYRPGGVLKKGLWKQHSSKKTVQTKLKGNVKNEKGKGMCPKSLTPFQPILWVFCGVKSRSDRCQAETVLRSSTLGPRREPASVRKIALFRLFLNKMLRPFLERHLRPPETTNIKSKKKYLDRVRFLLWIKDWSIWEGFYWIMNH